MGDLDHSIRYIYRSRSIRMVEIVNNLNTRMAWR